MYDVQTWHVPFTIVLTLNEISIVPNNAIIFNIIAYLSSTLCKTEKGNTTGEVIFYRITEMFIFYVKRIVINECLTLVCI